MGPELLEHILDGRKKPMNLRLSLLKNITENFSEKLEIGKGGFATVYKGVLPNKNVAVKRIAKSRTIDDALFYREVDSLLAVNHQNIVQFLGYCASTDHTAIQIQGSIANIYAEVRERLLCFEYISNGSLQHRITDELRGLEWNSRYEIIKGICNGLNYLHNTKNIYHMDLKPSNILLDSQMVPKITDFGLSRYDEKSHTMSADRYGSRGYCPPEYLLHGKMSFKSDMYSLGVIIIELVTGDKDIRDNNKDNVLRRWRRRWRKTGKETPLGYQQVTTCIDIGLLCQEMDPTKRPSIGEVLCDINEMDGTNGQTSNGNESFGLDMAPPDMQCAKEFVVWSTNVNDDLATEDITTEMFDKEMGNVVDDMHLDVVLDLHPLEPNNKLSGAHEIAPTCLDPDMKRRPTAEDIVQRLNDLDQEAKEAGMLPKMRKYVVLMTTMVATITYQAMLTRPGGPASSDMVLTASYPWQDLIFFYCNMMTFVASIMMILLLVTELRRNTVWFRLFRFACKLWLHGLIGAVSVEIIGSFRIHFIQV
uniref:Uncharacterized protein n=1 Tax=Avena sativa TaxID=4498 RepID=A0ACD5ZZY5_AVESA